ncbi:MAG: SAM-dependent chlorinase/fluorinase [Deltaproteobacteria bacterium]|nr:SAM-dependent chlorinase/fluorinase [Deltaproteobacteria bacterium]
MRRPIVTLTTDFGVSSPYVAELKAVLLAAQPELNLVDLTHAIPARSIRAAEVALRSAAFTFPIGTVHLVVVDPGVGTTRRPIAVAARGLIFVGPDNGVLGRALLEPGARAVVLDRKALWREPLSSTFHGRDLFAPVAAELACGLALEDVGSAIADPIPSTLPVVERGPGRVRGEVLAADDFGNLTSNIPAAEVDRGWRVTVGGSAATWCRTYGDAERGPLLCLAGSDGYLEIAIAEGSAAARLGATAGLPLVCERSERG